jgi:hypothetical protein
MTRISRGSIFRDCNIHGRINKKFLSVEIIARDAVEYAHEYFVVTLRYGCETNNELERARIVPA